MKNGVLGDFGDGDDTILYMQQVADEPRENCFAAYSNAGDQIPRPWLFFQQTLMVPDNKGKLNPQYFELEVCVLHEGEFILPEGKDPEEDVMLLRLKHRFAHFRFGRCKHHIVASPTERGAFGLYFPKGYADERVNWIAENAVSAWSLRVIQPETGNQRFALEFSFSNERDAVLFKTWWCG